MNPPFINKFPVYDRYRRKDQFSSKPSSRLVSGRMGPDVPLSYQGKDLLIKGPPPDGVWLMSSLSLVVEMDGETYLLDAPLYVSSRNRNLCETILSLLTIESD